MKIALACDHGAFELKGKILNHLEKAGHTVNDFGAFSTQSADYPDFALPAAESVANGESDKGIVVCTTGIGVSIVANKVKGIRCALVVNPKTAFLTRSHNDTNMMSLGALTTLDSELSEIIDTFLNTPFSGEERHQRRIDKITAVENKYFK